MKNEDFKNQLVNNLIPRVKLMIQKEEAHLKSLKERRAKYSKPSLLMRFFNASYSSLFPEVDKCILKSEINLSHLQIRCEEYTTYAKTI